MNTSSNNNFSQLIIIPEINKQKVTAANSIDSISAGLIITIFLLAHRAQLSSTLSKLDKQQVQQLNSAKWNAKQFAKAPIVRSTIAKLVVADTIIYDAKIWKNMSPDEANIYAFNVANDLANTPASPGIRLLSERAINDNNINMHRQALMAKYTGTWQAKPLYEPSSILKNIVIGSLSGNELGKLIALLHQTFQLDLDELFDSTSRNSESKEPFADALSACITKYLIQEEDDIIFNDAITLGTPDNLIPLERLIPNISRPLPNDLSYESDINSELLNSPLFNLAAAQNESLRAKASPKTKKAKPSPKAKPKSL